MRCPYCGHNRKLSRTELIAQGQLLLFQAENLPVNEPPTGRLIELCHRYGVSPEELADLIGMPTSFVKAMCEDDSLVDNDVYAAIMECLNGARNG